MADSTVSRVAVNFTSGQGGTNYNLALVRKGPGPKLKSSLIRLYPNVSAELFASAGKVYYNGAQGTESLKEILTFNNTNTASGARAISTLKGATLIYAFNPLTKAISESADFLSGASAGGNSTGLTFQAVNGVLKASKAFSGAVEVDYTATYRELVYEPAVSQENGLFTTEFGTVHAYYDGRNVSITLELSQINESYLGSSNVLYEVYSYVLENESGTWEVPPNFDSTGETWSPSVTGGTLTPPNAGGGYQRTRRVHEYGYLRGDGQVQYRVISRGNELPYSKLNNPFSPVKYFSWASASSFTGEWKDTLINANLGNITKEVQSRHGTLTFENGLGGPT